MKTYLCFLIPTRLPGHDWELCLVDRPKPEWTLKLFSCKRCGRDKMEWSRNLPSDQGDDTKV